MKKSIIIVKVFCFITALLIGSAGYSQIDSLLIEAIKSKNLPKVKELVGNGANVNCRYYYMSYEPEIFLNPIHITTDSGSYEIAKFLLENGADVNAKDINGRTPLYFAQTAEIALLLIEKGADVNVKDKNDDTPLHYAQTPEIALLLIEKGADVNAKDRNKDTPLHFANAAKIALLLIEKGAVVNALNKDGNRPLHIAKTPQIALALIEKGADVNVKNKIGETPLLKALQNNSKYSFLYDSNGMALVLLQHGADVNVKDNEGNTPLHLTYTADLTRLLIDKGANINAENNSGNTPLVIFSSTDNSDRLEKASVILEKGYKIDFRNSNGQTALIRVVIEKTDREALEFLLNNNADAGLKDKNNKTALDYALVLEKTEFVRLLSMPRLIRLLNSKGQQAVINLLKKDTTGVNQSDTYGFTLLHHMVYNTCDTLLGFITTQFKNSPLLNVLNREHQTPLLYAIYLYNSNYAIRLIESGADINLEGAYGEIPIYLAEERNLNDVVAALKKKKIILRAAIYPPELSVNMGNLGGVSGLSISPDGKTFISCNDNDIKLWDIASGKKMRNFIGNEYNVVCLSYSPDGKSFISSSDSTIKLWDITTGKELRTFVGQNKDITSLGFSPDGKSFISGPEYFGGEIMLWDIATGKELRAFEGQESAITSICFLPDGKSFISGSSDATIKLWDIATGKEKGTFTGHTEGVTSISISPDCKSFISGSADSTIKLWDIASGKEIKTFFGHADKVNCISFSPDGKSFISGSEDTTIKLWDIATGKEIRTFIGHTAKVNGISFLPDGKSFISGGWDETIKLWSVATGKELRSFQGFIANGKEVVIGRNQDIKLVDNALRKVLSRFLDHNNNYGPYSPDGKSYISANFDYSIKLQNVETDKVLKTFIGHTDEVRCLSYLPDGKSFVSGSLDHTIRIWDIASGKELQRFTGQDAVEMLNFSSDGKYIISGGWDNMKLWDIGTGKELRRFIGHEGMILKSCFSPDGKTILSGGMDKTLKLWDVATGIPIRTFSGHTAFINEIKFHSSGKFIVSSADDNTIKFWRTDSPKEIATLVFTDSTDWVLFSPDKYYTTTKNGANALGWLKGLQVWNFDQWDLQYNRPDIVFGRMPDPDTAMIKLYYKAYQKRLKKMNFKESMFRSDFNTPQIKIEKQANINQQTIELVITAVDTLYPIDRINVWVNEVPVYGINGISLRNEKQSKGIPVKKQLTLILSEGDNKIEVSGLNSAGAESVKQTAWAKNESSPVKKDLYFIAISCADYKDNNYNLKYSVKDGRDMAKQFAGASDTYANIFIDTLFNKDVTRERVAELKKALMKSKVDDQVILFTSGHGLLSDSLDFYFATYDIDFQHPEKRGISFDNLESILDSIPARKKLLMMDACHSGEVDKEEIGDMLAVNTTSTPDIAFRGSVREYNTRGADTKDTRSGITLNNSFELMQELFTGLDKGTGTTVISAAAGKGYALESPQWNNGVFTYSIINGMRNKAADKNGDGIITISELKDYSIKQVDLLTGGKQKPTARRESINYDWKIW